MAAIALVVALHRPRPVRPFTDPIPRGARTDPSSPRMIRTLVAGAGGGFLVSAGRWTTSVYYAGPKTPPQTVALTASWAPARRLTGVPIPDGAKPDPSADAHLTIVDEQRGCEYDLWQARRAADGSWSASWANARPADGSGVYPGGWAATAAGFTNLAGKLWPDELRTGRIHHALVFAFPYTKAGGPVPPATASDGESTDTGAIPEGARLRLDPSLRVDSLHLSRWQKAIARALQVYGMYLGDTGGTVGLSAVNARSFSGVPYPWGDADYAYLPTSLLSHMRVLTLPPQYQPVGKLIPTGCATLQ